MYLEGKRCHVGLDVDLTSGLIPSRYKDLPFEKFVRLKSTTCKVGVWGRVYGLWFRVQGLGFRV